MIRHGKLLNRRTGLLAAAMILVISSFGSAAQSSVPPAEVASAFYKWYLRALYQKENADPFKESKIEIEKFVTARLLQKLMSSRQTSRTRKGPDSDTEYFFGTLDLSSEWESNIVVSEPAMNGEMAVVHVSFSGRNPETKQLEIQQARRVALKQVGNTWEIDDVGAWR